MNNSKISFYPEPIKMTEDGKIEFLTQSNSQNQEKTENSSTTNVEKNINFEKLMNFMGKDPKDFLSSMLATNFFGGKSTPMAEMLSKMFTQNKKNENKDSQNTTFEEF